MNSYVKVITEVITYFIISLVFYYFWNLAVPKVFGLPSIEYTDAMALYGLSNILFIKPSPTPK